MSTSKLIQPDALLNHSRLRFLLSVVLLPLVLPGLAWAQFCASQGGSFSDLLSTLALCGAVLWALLVLPSLLRGLPTEQASRLRLQGQLMMTALQLIALSVWLPFEPIQANGAEVRTYALVRAAAIAGAYAFGWLLAGVRRDALNPAALTVILIALLVSARPAVLFGAVTPIASDSSCAAGVWSGTGLCLLSDDAAAGALLVVVLALLIDARRWCGSALALLGLLSVGYFLYAPLRSVDPLLAASVAVLFFPGQPYQPVLRRFLSALLWIGGFAVGALFFSAGSPATDRAAHFWLLGLCLAELGLPLVWAAVTGLRRESE